MQHWTAYIPGLLFLATSCGHLDNKTTNTPNTDTSITQTISPSADSLQSSILLTNGNILGNWTNCATISGGVQSVANVCRTIEFKKNNTAVITYPSKEKQVVNWTISDDQLIINLTGRKSDAVNRILTDSIYKMTLTKDSIGLDLELRSKNKDLIYSLRKELSP